MKPDALAHLADALMEDIAATPPHQLAIEEIVEAGRSRELVFRFDDILADASTLSGERPSTTGSRAIWNLTDALCEDIGAEPDETVPTENSDGRLSDGRSDDRSLAGKFDDILRRDPHLAMAGLKLPRPSGPRPAMAVRAAFAQLLDRLIAPLHSRAAAGAFATVVTAVIIAAVYQPVHQTLERERIAAALREPVALPVVARPAPPPVLPDTGNAGGATRPSAAPQPPAATQDDMPVAAASPVPVPPPLAARPAPLPAPVPLPAPAQVASVGAPRSEAPTPPPAAAGGEGDKRDAARGHSDQPDESRRSGEETARKIAEAEARLAEEQTRLATLRQQQEEERKRVETQREEEGQRRRQEAMRLEEERRKEEEMRPRLEARRQADEQRKAAEAQRQAEERRQEALRLQQEELKRQEALALRQQEEQKQKQQAMQMLALRPDQDEAKEAPQAPAKPTAARGRSDAPAGLPHRDAAPPARFSRQAARPQPADVETRLKTLEDAARDGDVAALWKLGRMYADGDGVPQDHPRAFGYFRRITEANATPVAADADGAKRAFIANAFVEAGRYSLTGIADSDVKPDPERARDMFAYAATNLGDPDAQYELGRMYLDGNGVARDPKQAARWLSMAAARGQYEAQAAFGSLLLKGPPVVPRDAAKGLMWLKLAVDAAPRGDTGIADLYDAAWKRATEKERTAALSLVEQWRNGPGASVAESNRPAASASADRRRLGASGSAPPSPGRGAGGGRGTGGGHGSPSAVGF